MEYYNKHTCPHSVCSS